ncbi:MAG: hypothetical protein CML46_05040 [Rhodobacteraceae bacterium]|nr:hypothetical protein [Paracoccaceae bacterium]MBR26299.1 hypothetical protein [Paracoccaceae bacterium]
MTQVEAADVGGVSRSSQKLYEKGNSPTAEYLSSLAGIGVDVLYLLTGERSKPLQQDAGRQAVAADFERAQQQTMLSDIAALASHGAAMPTESGRPPSGGLSDYVPLPLHDVELAAGGGALNDSEAVGRHLLFRQDWMRKLGLLAANARLARVRGDSMIPLLSDGDLVLVDLSKTEIPVELRRPGAPRRAHLVAIEHEGESRVKWMERPTEDSLIIYSENAALYPPEVYTRADAERIRLIGRVVWWCHTVRGA